jgi:pleiotropic regulator 1
LSGIYALKLHPTLDILVTAGRDAVARVWDMRTKHQIHVLSGHEHTVTSLLTAAVHPQIVTASHDSTVKLWDLAAGKCFTTLTHHGKSVRALADAAGRERTFVSASADGTIRKWQGKNGKFLQSIRHNNDNNNTGRNSSSSTIWNAVAVQEDGVMVSGSDDGKLDFWDYDTGYCFQRANTLVQPGSLAQAENAVLCTQFDRTGTRLVTGHADKTLQIWKADGDMATSELTHPIDMKQWRKTCLARAQERY